MADDLVAPLNASAPRVPARTRGGPPSPQERLRNRRGSAMGNEIRHLSATVGAKANMATTRGRLSYNSRSWLDTCRMIGGLCRGGFFVVPWVALTLLSVAIVVLARVDWMTLSKEAHEDLQVPTEVLTTFGATMSLLLAFRLNVSYQRWWEARECKR